MTAPNIFDSLLRYRPRIGRSSKENFLTEVFAHTLRKNPEVCCAWLRHLLGEPVVGEPKVQTQVTVNAHNGEDRAILDMVVHCDLEGGRKVTVFSEHKWDSPHDGEQLSRYLRIAKDWKARLVFVAPPEQVQAVQAEGITTQRWSEVHEFMRATNAEGVHEFVEFISLQTLGPQKPLSTLALAGYVAGREIEGICDDIAEKLSALDWNVVPKHPGSAARHENLRWGRIGIEFGNWRPYTLFLGFLLDGRDHQLDLVAPRSSIDLMLSLDCRPKILLDPEVLASLARTLPPDAHVLHGAQLKNRWRKIVVREPLAATINGHATGDAQVEAIYQRLKGWCEMLFGDGRLERVLAGLRS